MGNQQLLVIVIAVVIISIAIAVGVTLFRDSAASSNRDQLVADLAQYGVRAQAYFRRPSSLGGGQGTFNGLTIDKITAHSINMNGTYSLEPDPVAGTPASIKLVGVGTETGLDGTNRVKATMVVFCDTMRVDETLGN